VTRHTTQGQRTPFNIISKQLNSYRTTINLRTLEDVIIRKDINDEPIQISSTCVELDREVVTVILENLIFCHQEESN
ncbi:unnamed protein product, partial [Rotaria sp. Silwood2]